MLQKLLKLKSIYKQHGSQGLLNTVRANLLKLSPTQIKLRFATYKSLTHAELQAQQALEIKFSYRPKISVILPVYNPELEYLKQAVDSVVNQTYSNWELCIADDKSTKIEILDYLNDLPKADSRIKVVLREQNGHISACSNSALELATGDYIALLDHDDCLTLHALFEVVSELNKDRTLDVLYSNEDKLDRKGKRCEPAFKAGWSPDYLLAMMYLGHLGVYRKVLVDKVGGFRPGFEGSQDFDLALRVCELSDRVKHIPKILYHWRKHPESTAVNIDSKPYAFVAGKKAVKEALLRRGVSAADVTDGKAVGIYRAVFTRPENSALLTIPIPAGIATLKDFFSKACTINPDKYLLFTTNGVELSRQSQAEDILQEVGRPALGLLCGKIYYKNKILAAGARLEKGNLVANFNGQHIASFGYGARLYCHHNINVVWPAAFIINTKVLENALISIPEIKCLSAFVCYLSFKLKLAGLNHVFSPYIEFNSNKETAPQMNIKEHSQLFSALGIELESYIDNYYPRELENTQLLFSVNI